MTQKSDYYTRFNPNGTSDIISIPSKEGHEKLFALQQAIGGHIESVRISRGFGWVDEEGGPMCKNLPINNMASVLAKHPIYGPLLIKNKK